MLQIVVIVQVLLVGKEQVQARAYSDQGQNAQVNTGLEHKEVVARHSLYLHDDQAQKYARYHCIHQGNPEKCIVVLFKSLVDLQ